MTGNGRRGVHETVLHWPRRVFSVRDLEQNLNGHRELVLAADTILTPLAGDELRSNGIKVTRLDVHLGEPTGLVWGYAQDRQHGLILSAVRTLAREGIVLRDLGGVEEEPCRWAKAMAECVARGDCAGGVLFCEDPGLVCCVANKIPGLRAVPVSTVAQVARASLTLAANLLAVEMPGRTFFEIRQILRICATPNELGCPEEVACTLKELDGHAHR